MKIIEKWRGLSDRTRRWVMTAWGSTWTLAALVSRDWIAALVCAGLVVGFHAASRLLQRAIDRHRTHFIRITLTDGQRLTGVAYGCPRCIRKHLRSVDTFPATDQFGEEHLVATARIEDVLLAPYDGPDDRFADATES